MCTTVIDRMGDRCTTQRNTASSYRYYLRFTLRLSDRCPSSSGRDGVTLRRVAHNLSHLRRKKASMRHILPNYPQVRAQSLITPHSARHWVAGYMSRVHMWARCTREYIGRHIYPGGVYPPYLPWCIVGIPAYPPWCIVGYPHTHRGA